MASLIPSLNSCLSRMQAGEKRFARCLESLLEDDYLCWYELAVGKRQRYTDFIILHPVRGLLLLEVKDWKIDNILKIDKTSTTLLTPSGLKKINNPLEQVRQCTYALIERLEKDPQLRDQSGRYQGRLAFPYGFGVVLTSITRKQFESTDLGEVLPEHKILCKDEMLDILNPEAFQTRLWNMFDVRFPRTLTLPQIDRIRWHLFPEIRIDAKNQSDLFASDLHEKKIAVQVPDILKVMDTQQELLARSLGEGHRVIHGVAGSGKTLILGYRCLHLAQSLHKPILVLCYNIVLAGKLRQFMVDRDIIDRVNVYHFHDWCGEQLRAYHVECPNSGDDAYYDRIVETVISAAENGRIPSGQYGAVMIDEGHDFKPEWLKLVVSMVDPEINSLLLLYDDAQSIYGENSCLDFSLSSVGIHARGRTTILKLNYRNTEEILRFAYRFVSRYLTAAEKEGDPVTLLEPCSIGRHGPQPVVKILNDVEEEVMYVARLFRRMHEERGIPWSDMCVTYSNRWLGKKLHERFKSEQIPCQWLGHAKARKRYNPISPNVLLTTMHSSKGLEFPLVAVSGAGYLPANGTDLVAAAKLLYVAMTRSIEKLLITSHRDTEFLAHLNAANSIDEMDNPQAAIAE
jgi:Nuclease-related domain/UvrD-like helicase C-terminal domain/AAA domain